MAVSIFWCPVTKSTVIQLHPCNPASSLKYLFYFALYKYLAVSIFWCPVTKSTVIHLHPCNPASSLKYLFYFALYNLWLFIQFIGIFGGICSGKLGNTTFHNQPADSILKLQSFRAFDIKKKFPIQFFHCHMFCFTETCDTDKWCTPKWL